jgi:hypothetical protein
VLRRQLARTKFQEPLRIVAPRCCSFGTFGGSRERYPRMS